MELNFVRDYVMREIKLLLLLTAQDSKDKRVIGLDAGADDYV